MFSNKKKRRSPYVKASTPEARKKQKLAIAEYYKQKNRNTKKRGKGKRIEKPYPHFRYYKKSKHPALIVGEQSVDEYKYRKVTHSERDGRHLNEKVYPNPNPNDKEPMYIGKRIRHDKKENFEDKPLPWKYPKK